MQIIKRNRNRNKIYNENKTLKNFNYYLVLTYKQKRNDYKRIHLIKSSLRFNIL